MIRDLIALLVAVLFPPEAAETASTALPPIVELPELKTRIALPAATMQRGRWKTTGSGCIVWQLALRVPAPITISVHLTGLSAEGEVRVYAAANSALRGGPYPDARARGNRQWSDPLKTSMVIVEYAPVNRSRRIPFRIYEVAHAIIETNEHEPIE